MTLPQEKSPRVTLTDLPNPELNPMLNPILGRNLGRWAHVYFTTPPEQREQAVMELLRELEAESGNPPRTQAPAAQASASIRPVPVSLHEVPKRPVAREPGACAECGHPSVPGQRFCGMCGSPLLRQQPDQGRRSEIPPFPTSTESRPAQNAPQQVFPTLSLFAEVLDERAPQPSNGHGESEVEWLRDKNRQLDLEASPDGNWLRYGFVLIAVVLLDLLYYANSHRPVANQRASRPTPAVTVRPEDQAPAKTPEPAPIRALAPTSSPARETLQTPAKTQATPPARQPTPGAVAVATTPSAAPVLAQNVTALAGQQASRPLPAPTPPAAASTPINSAEPATPAPEPGTANPASGAMELATAQNYLAGKTRPRDSAAAATFLWAAVRKENSTAVLLLAELYLAGDGVPKSCDQARVLLTAAARKQVPEAVTRLRELKTSGCP